MIIIVWFFRCRVPKRKHRPTLTVTGQLWTYGPDRSAALDTGERSVLRRRQDQRDAGGPRHRRRVRPLPHDF